MWRRWVEFPRVTVVALVLAAGLGIPTLGTGQFADDYIHTATIKGLVPMGGRLDLFSFASGHPERTSTLVRLGLYPWWTLPELRLAFWRPLSSAIAYVEYQLVGDRLVLRHVHSVLWYMALVATVALIMRRLFPTAIGPLALLLFTVDDAHVVPVAWLANRNALIAVTPALLGLWMHLLWRENGKRWALPVSVLAWTVGLLGGESAVGVFGYAAAYEALSAPGSRRSRAKAILPLVALFITYAVTYRLLGRGAWGSGSYLDPIAQGASYFGALGPRLLALSAGALLNIPAELGMNAAPSRWFDWSAGFIAMAGCSWGARRLWPSLSSEEQRHCRWLWLGAVLAMLPVAAAFPSNRLLVVPSLGVSVLLAVLILGAWRQRRRITLAGLGVLHLALPIVAWFFFSWVGLMLARYSLDVAFNVDLDPARVSSQRVVILVVPDGVVGMYTGLVRRMNGLPTPQAWLPLTLAPQDHRVTRTGPGSLDLELVEGRFLRSEFEQLFRAKDHPMRVGDRVELPGLIAEIMEADALGPRRVSFAFDRSLDDPSMLVLAWRDGRLRPYAPPAIGRSEIIPFESTPLSAAMSGGQ
jgi:hypothetical protein